MNALRLVPVLLLCGVACRNISQEPPVAGNPDATGAAVVYLPQVPADFLAKQALTGVDRLELIISGRGMDSISRAWQLGSIPTEPVTITGIPVGTRLFAGRLVNRGEVVTHQGQVSCTVNAGETVNVTLRLAAVTGSARVCIEVEGLPSSCDTDSVSSQGLVAYYPFSGSARDASGMGNHGVVNGAVLTADRHGAANSAYAFVRSAYIEVAHSASLDCEQAVSVTAWAKSRMAGDAYTADGVVAQKGTAAEEAYGLSYHTGTQSIIGIYRNHWAYGGPNGAYDIDGGTHSYATLDTSWHFYAMTFDGDTLRLYRDGRQVDRIVALAGNLTDLPLRIGAQSKSLERFWQGAIDEVRVYNRGLSAAEVARLYQQ
jgi:hypothetical protein